MKSNGSAAPSVLLLNDQAGIVEETQHVTAEKVAKTLPTPPPSVRLADKVNSQETRVAAEPSLEGNKSDSNGHVQHTPGPDPPAQDAEQTKKRRNVLTRTLWTFIMIGGFISTSSIRLFGMFLLV